MIDKTSSSFIISLILYLLYISVFILIGVKILDKKNKIKVVKVIV